LAQVTNLGFLVMFLITVKNCELTYLISGNYNVQKNQGSVNETSVPEDGA
jgi:hypothetical protein